MSFELILFIGGPVDWEGGPLDWRVWETWMGDVGYRGKGCVTKKSTGGGCVSLEAEEGK